MTVSHEISNVPCISLSVGSAPVLFQQKLTVLYPKINSPETIECDCLNYSCDSVFWFRINSSNHIDVIGKLNNADRVTWGKVDSTKYKLNKRSTTSFVLRVNKVTEADKGIYSCVLKHTNNEVWKPGTLLLPGGLYAEVLHLQQLGVQ